MSIPENQDSRHQQSDESGSVFHKVRHVARVVLAIPVWIYQKVISPALPPHCIYVPTCSEYTRQAILTHGLLGIILWFFRVFRCVGGLYSGGGDPVPEKVTAGYLFGSYKRFWRRREEKDG